MKTTPVNAKVFIQKVVNGYSYTEAYKLAFPNKSLTSGALRVESSKLVKKYAKEIAAERDFALKVVEATNKETLENGAKKAIADLTSRMVFLTSVMNGEIRVKKPIVISGKIMEYPCEPDLSSRISACAELNKMEGSYKAQKIELGQSFVLKVGYGGEDE